MMRIALCISILLFAVWHPAVAQVTNNKVDRVLFVLDGSNNMNQKWNGERDCYEQASGIITTMMDSIYQVNEDVEFGLRVYGHQYSAEQHNCTDSRIEVGFSKDNRGQMALRLNDLEPKGSSALNYAVGQGLKYDLIDTGHYRYSFIIIQNEYNDECGVTGLCSLLNTADKNILFKTYLLMLGDQRKTRAPDCVDNAFFVNSDNASLTAIRYITSRYYKKRKLKQVGVVNLIKKRISDSDQEGKNVLLPATDPMPTLIRNALSEKNNRSGNVKESTAWKMEVKTKMTSKIIIQAPENYGYVHLVNISLPGKIKIFCINAAEEEEVKYPPAVGADPMMFKLPVGKYKIIHMGNNSQESVRLFSVKSEMITDVIFD